MPRHDYVLHGRRGMRKKMVPEVPLYPRTPYLRDGTHASPSWYALLEELGLCSRPMSSSCRWLDSDGKHVGPSRSTSSIQLSLRGSCENHWDTSDLVVRRSTTLDPYLARMISLTEPKKSENMRRREICRRMIKIAVISLGKPAKSHGSHL